MFYVYAIKALSKNKIYIGHTQDLDRRLEEHYKGRNKATKAFNDWVLVYQEVFSSRALAVKRELFLKSGDGRRTLKFKYGA